MTALEKWKNDFKGYISELSMPRDDYKGIMEYIDEVPNETRWIPVSERLPESEKNGYYLVTFKDEDYYGDEIFIVRIVYWTGVRWSFNCEETDNVVAWMSLPKPYEPQESEDKE